MQIATKYSIIIIIYGMKSYAMQYKKYKNQAVVNLHINQGPTVTLMWHAKSQAKPQTYFDSHCFIIKPRPT